MHDEGYAAATSRRVAAKAGVVGALVPLILSDDGRPVHRGAAGRCEVALEQMRAVLLDDDRCARCGASTVTPADRAEHRVLAALANHRKAIGAELKAYSERVRDIETAAVTLVLRANGVDLNDRCQR